MNSSARSALKFQSNQPTASLETQVASQFLQDLVSWKSWLMGGFSILFFFGSWFFVPKNASVFTVAAFMASMAFVVNHPHFLSSYILLYSDNRHKIFKKIRFFWAAILVPVALLLGLVYAMTERSEATLAWTVNFMFLTVGWHYVKQTFGCVIVSSAQQKKFHTPWERRILLTNLFFVWMVSWITPQVGSSKFEFYGIHYDSFNFPEYLRTGAYVLLGLSLLFVCISQVRKYILTGYIPSAVAVVSFASLYVWYIPLASHPFFGYSIPLFHSMQYLTLVTLMKKNETDEKANSKNPVEVRGFWVTHFWGFLVTAVFLGAMAFEFVPNFLDAQWAADFKPLTAQIFLASFNLFINIHHYFIDNVLWRSDSPELRRWLFQPTAKAS